MNDDTARVCAVHLGLFALSKSKSEVGRREHSPSTPASHCDPVYLKAPNDSRRWVRPESGNGLGSWSEVVQLQVSILQISASDGVTPMLLSMDHLPYIG
jgi:hypothetical protein